MTVPEVSQYFAAAGSAGGEGPSGNQQVVAKLLVPNPVAGSIIGKSGGNIEQLQKSSGARIQLSRSGEFFPGTSDRVLLLSGSLHSVLTSIFLILEKISRDGSAPSRSSRDLPNEGGSQVKLALSRRLCGLLIGHKGQTVRDFITDSGSAIRVQSLSELSPSDPERTITVMGARDQVLRAVALILNTLSLHEGYASYMETTLQLATSQGVVLPPRSSTTRSVLSQIKTSLTFYLPDDDVGAILGRKGQNLADIQQSARVTIKISDRSKMDPSLNEREVTIAGLYGAVKLAEAMIAEKLNQSRARANGRANDEEEHADEEPHEVHA